MVKTFLHCFILPLYIGAEMEKLEQLNKTTTKQYSEIEAKSYFEDDKEIFEIIISTSNIDQAGDIMNLDGVDLSLFNTTKSVFYNHDSQAKPIAKCLGITKAGDRLLAKVWFHEYTADSKEVKELVKAGVINCASIGFDVISVSNRPLTDDEKIKLPRLSQATIFEKWKLIEFSIVNIPMNAEAQILRSLKFKQDLEQSGIEKSGRTLSKANETKLQNAIELLQSVLTSTQEIIESAEPKSKEVEMTEIEPTEETIEKDNIVVEPSESEIAIKLLNQQLDEKIKELELKLNKDKIRIRK